MDYFKHFVTGHNSTPMLELMDEFGVEGYGAYFILMEIIVDKLQKDREEVMTLEHCRVRFHEREVRQKLRFRSTKVELFLNSCATKGLLEWTKDGQKLNFYVPKILEFLDRHSKKARTAGPKEGLKKENKNKNIYKGSLAQEPAIENSDAARLEARFTPDYQNFVDGLKSVGNITAINFKSRIPLIQKRFESYENFKTWANNILKSKKAETFSSEEELQNYFNACLHNFLTEKTA